VKLGVLSRRVVRKNIPIVSLQELSASVSKEVVRIRMRFTTDEELFELVALKKQAMEFLPLFVTCSKVVTYSFPKDELPNLSVPDRLLTGMAQVADMTPIQVITA